MNICFYAYGFDHLMIEKLTQNAKFIAKYTPKKILIIADNRTHMHEYVSLSKDVLYLSDFDKEKANIDIFSPSNNYHLAMKRYTLLDMPSYYQDNVYCQISNLINNFFRDFNVDYLFFLQEIQSMEGVLINKIAQKNNIKSFVPHSSRLEFLSFINNSHQENLPILNEIDNKGENKAKELIMNFGNTSKIPYPIYKNIPFPKKSIFLRIYVRIIRFLIHNEEIEWGDLKWSFFEKINFLKKFNSIKSKKTMNKYVTISSFENLPDKFIFFPLQIFPEASLNLRNPFFKDQLRLIDLIRFSMPKNYKLILKEHPWMIDKRDKNFYKKIGKLSGVRLACIKLNTHELIKKASLTISVSGTANFEAFLLGKPSFTISETAFSCMTNTLPIDYNDFHKTLLNYINKEIKSSEIKKHLSLYFSNLYNFNSLTCEFDINYSLSEDNINNFTEALINFEKSYYIK